MTAPYAKEWSAIPEWPKGYRRIVRNMHIAWIAPNHVGRFRDRAFPSWWNRLRRIIIEPVFSFILVISAYILLLGAVK